MNRSCQNNPGLLLTGQSSGLSAGVFKALGMPLIIRAGDKEISRVQRVAGNGELKMRIKPRSPGSWGRALPPNNQFAAPS